MLNHRKVICDPRSASFEGANHFINLSVWFLHQSCCEMLFNAVAKKLSSEGQPRCVVSFTLHA